MGLLFFHMNCSGTNPLTNLINSLSSKNGSPSLAQKVGKFLPTSSKQFVDIYAMESQVRNHRNWVQEKSKEMISTKKALRSLMNASRQSDFQLYQFLDANLSVMKAAHENILSNAKKEKKLIIRVQKSKKIDINTKIPGKDNSYLQQFIILDNAIDLRKSAYQESILKIKKALIKRDMDLVIIKEQKDEWFFITEELSNKRKRLQPSIEILTTSLVDAISNDSNHIQKLSKQLNKVENINKRLDSLDKFFLNVDRVAEKQKGGHVYLKKNPESKEEYEIRFENSVKDYEKYLENLSQLFIN